MEKSDGSAALAADPPGHREPRPGSPLQLTAASLGVVLWIVFLAWTALAD